MNAREEYFVKTGYAISEFANRKALASYIKFLETKAEQNKEELIEFFKWCETEHFINLTGNYEEVIKQYQKSKR